MKKPKWAEIFNEMGRALWKDSYLEQLISYRFDGLVKVITGIRRCDKSYLLKNIYRDYLTQNGVKEEQIITIELDLAKDIKYRNPLILSSYVKESVLTVTVHRGNVLKAAD